LRAQVLYVLGACGLAITGGALLLAPIALGQVKRIIVDLGLMAMSLVGLLLLSFLGTSLMGREIERRTIEVLLAKPIRRAEYLLGNYLGLVLALGLFVVAETGFLSLAVILATGSFDPKPLLGGAMVMVELSTLAAVVLLFGSFAGPLVSTFLVISTYVAGRLSGDLADFGAAAKAPLLTWIACVLPNLASFDVRPEVVHGFAIDPGRIGLALAHAASYTAGVLALATLIFERRELK
jgi:ABC-type transport system involved in multi-copper enzyme maturation permease subunit